MSGARPDDLACIRLVELLTEYLDGALGADQHALVDAHLATCAGCRTALDQFRTTIALTGRLRDEDICAVEATTVAQLTAAFVAARGQRQDPAASAEQ